MNHTQQLSAALEKYWGYDSYRPLQQEAMQCVMADRDSVVVLPTGGGKSICFQAPAVCREGTAVVVSPLISLMKDQVDALRECGIEAAAINSTMGPEEKRETAQRIREGHTKLMYVAPERLLQTNTLSFLTQFDVSFIAIDEAHCISSWGHDFRPEYRGLRQLKEVLPNVAVHAYTATASEQVRGDIALQLGLHQPEFLVGSFDRPNLVYRVGRAKNKLGQIQQVVKRHAGESGIVYCISRKEVERTAGALCELGVNAAPYHAGLSDQQRQDHQEAFIEERVDVIVATVAFGMGIDKSNVRYVIHAGMPKSIENYQQESGRAGRDGLEADCLLLYSPGDATTWRKMTDMSDAAAAKAALESIDKMSRFAGAVACRHKLLVEHFGQTYEQENCGACDVCLGDLEFVKEPLILAQKVLSCVARLEQRYGGDYTAKVLTGSAEARILDQGHNRLSTYGLLKQHPASTVRDWIEQLVGQGYLEKVGEYDVLQLTEQGVAILKGDGSPRLLKPAAKKSTERRGGVAADSWEGVDRGLFEELRGLRGTLAAEHGVPAYIVFGDATLRDMARLRPSTLESFSEVKGVGQKKLAEYGEEFTAAIASYCQQHELTMDQSVPAVPENSAAEDDFVPSAASLAAFKYFRNGQTIEETMAAMSRARSTVVGYLNQYIKHEGITDPTTWVDATTARQVEEAIEEVGLKGLRPIYVQLNEQVDYDSIRIVASCVANRG